MLIDTTDVAVSEHVLQRPAWLESLVDVVLDAVEPFGFFGSLGYCWWGPGDPGNSFQGWKVIVYPLPLEASGGSNDGCRVVTGFGMRLGSVLAAFSQFDQETLAWHSPVQYNGNLDGPAISVQGSFANKRVWLRILSVPPADEATAYLIDMASGAVREKPPD